MFKFRVTLQKKIVFSFLLVVMAGGSIALLFGIVLYGKTVLTRAQTQVTVDLNSAWMVYNQKAGEITTIIKLTAKREGIVREVRKRNTFEVQKMLEQVRITNKLDFLTLTDVKGNVVVRSRYPYIMGDDQSNDEMVKRALTNESITGTQILSQDELIREGDGMAEQAFMVFIDTRLATPRPRDRETSGMVIKAAVAVTDSNDELLGVLYGGVLLDRNYEIVDQIRNIIYRDESYRGREIGTATIFQWDVRISTNVKNANGLRAIGTRVSRDVYEMVLENGQPYIGRAYVVNADYITAYEPIRNILGEVIGMLYVGILEQPFIDTRKQVIFLFLIIALIGILVALFIGYFIARSISNPVQKLVLATHEVSKGNFPRTMDISSEDEIGQLAQAFLDMSQRLQKTMADLKELNQRYLGLLGFTTHELKQPLGVIKGYLIMLQDETLGKLTSPLQKEALLEMRSNVNALNDMIQKYLQLAKIEAGQLAVEKKQINLFEEALSPVLEGEAAQLSIKNMYVEIEDKEKLKTVMINADPILMRIVFSNLITNAIKYGKKGGLIAISFQEEKELYRFHVKNEGPGISYDKLETIFGKFVRVDIKELGKQLGTGLGLYNTREIIEKHGGTIRAESEEGKWADFIFILPKHVRQE